MPQSHCNLWRGEMRTVIAFDQQCDSAPFIHVTSPTDGLIQHCEFLEQHPILLQRTDVLGTARPTVNPISHGSCLLFVFYPQTMDGSAPVAGFSLKRPCHARAVNIETQYTNA